MAKGALKLNELEKELKTGRLRPVYLLAGSEPLLRDDALAAIRSSALDSGAEDFNLDRLPGQTTTPSALQDSTRSLPVMASHRLVILSDPEGRRAGAKALVEALADVVVELCTQQETVLVITAVKADRRAKWVRAITEPGAIVECDPPSGARSIAAFVRREAKRQGMTLDSGAAELLSDRIGPQLLMLRQELAKAALLAGEGAPVSCAHVEASSCQVAEQPIWDLTDAIGSGNTGEAALLLSRLLSGGAAPIVVLGTLASHFRKLARLRGGASVPGPPFVVRKLENQAQRYTTGRLLACLRAIHETDTALKGVGPLPPNLAIERLVIGLAG